MLCIIAFGPSLIAVIAAVILLIVLRKKDPAKMAVVFSAVALVCGISHIICEFFPFDYSGPGGLDYIGQAIVWGLAVQSVLYGTLVAYISFAIVATVFALKALKVSGKRRRGAVSLILSWICGLVICCLVITNIVSDQTHKRNISVEVKSVTSAVDTDGDPAVVIMYEIHNGTKSKIMYQTAVYEQVTQNGKELSYGIVDGPKELKDSDIKYVEPGNSAIVRKTYKLREPGAPVNIVLRTYGGDYTYLVAKYTPK